MNSTYTPCPIFLARPLSGALLFANEASDARDHCANERTFLAWLRLSIYLAVVSSAILVSFHLRGPPPPAHHSIERRAAVPLGVVFWALSLACLASGFAIYVRTVTLYGRKAALVQSGWRTQAVFVVVAAVIVGCCVFFLSTGQ
ncbi:hypothetical protein VTN02DRAFT_1157 [Thermoascus thermophilus]